MESFEQLSVQYAPMINKIIRSLNIYKNKDEFYQLALIGLWEASQRYDPARGNFTNYAYSLIKGKLQNEMTKMNKEADSVTTAKEDFWLSMIDEAPAAPLEREDLLAFCLDSRLTDNQTKWVLYHSLQSLSVKEIAQIEQVSISAVKAWRVGAKEKLRNNWKKNTATIL